MKIYIVTSGEDSEYCIDGVFSSAVLAEEWIGKHDDECWRGRYTVEPYVVDELKEAKQITIWRVAIKLDTGEIIENSERRELEVPFRGRVMQHAVRVPAYSERLVSRVESGVSKEHCLTLAAEVRQKWLMGEEVELGPYEPKQ